MIIKKQLWLWFVKSYYLTEQEWNTKMYLALWLNKLLLDLFSLAHAYFKRAYERLNFIRVSLYTRLSDYRKSRIRGGTQVPRFHDLITPNKL
jgi:hypothetical protein